MSSLLLLVVCAALGIVTSRLVKGAAGFTLPLNWWVLNIALPALVLEMIAKLEFDLNLWFLLVSQWLVFCGAWAVAATLGQAFHWSRGSIGAVTLTAGIGNTLFIGYPVIETILGREGLPYAVVADQGGAFMAFILGGAVVTAVYGGQQNSTPVGFGRLIWLRLVRFPALYAVLAGVAVGALGGWPADLDAVLLRLGATITPLALFSAGLQFRLNLSRDQRAPLILGLGWKLVLAPVLVYLMGAAADIGHLILSVGVLQAGMPAMVSAVILADQQNLDPPLANTMLAVGILLSVVTLTVIAVLL
jgi:predicted permease